MWRGFAAVAVLGLALAGCRGGHGLAADPSLHVAPAPPPTGATWPPYPAFPAHSCWGRETGDEVMRVAPSYVESHPATPREAASRLLARFGDRRYVRSIVFGPVTPRKRAEEGMFVHGQPPADALWASISNPAADLPDGGTPEQVLAASIADWESVLVGGALRDDLCAAGGPPLVGWTSKGDVQMGAADATHPLGQRFPNPDPAVFRQRVADVGRRYGFRVETLRLLRPRGIAPLLVVTTDRDRRAFIGDVQAIVNLLDPTGRAEPWEAATFEGFFLAARDDKGPFVWVSQNLRGTMSGGQWSADPDGYPYLHG